MNRNVGVATQNMEQIDVVPYRGQIVPRSLPDQLLTIVPQGVNKANSDTNEKNIHWLNQVLMMEPIQLLSKVCHPDELSHYGNVNQMEDHGCGVNASGELCPSPVDQISNGSCLKYV